MTNTDRSFWGTYLDVTPGDTVAIPLHIVGRPYYPGFVASVQHWGPAGPVALAPAFEVSSVRTYGSLHPALGVAGQNYGNVVGPEQPLWITPGR